MLYLPTIPSIAQRALLVRVRGNVEAEERIALRAGATIVGDIKTAGIIIEDGAYFKGGIDISKTDAPKGSQKASQAAAGDKR